MEKFSALLAIWSGNSPGTGDKGQWRAALMFSLICVRINGWVNNGEVGDLRRNRAHYNVSIISAWLHIHVTDSAYTVHFLLQMSPKLRWRILTSRPCHGSTSMMRSGHLISKIHHTEDRHQITIGWKLRSVVNPTKLTRWGLVPPIYVAEDDNGLFNAKP